jgi:hypothetical protein
MCFEQNNVKREEVVFLEFIQQREIENSISLRCPPPGQIQPAV